MTEQEPKIENEKIVGLANSEWESIPKGLRLGSDYAELDECNIYRELARKIEQKLGE